MSDAPPLHSIKPAQSSSEARGGNRVDEVRTYIVGRIEGGDLVAGDRLPTEKELAERHGVSRPVVREAIARLVAEGMVRTERGKGSFVQPPQVIQQLVLNPITSIDDLLALQELRLAIEQEAGRLAATRRSEEDLERIVEINQSLLATSGDYRNGGELDNEFHVAIAAASHNTVILDAQRALGNHTKQWISTVLHTAPEAKATRNEYRLREHDAIIEAIKRMDPDAAALAIRRHIENGRTRFLAHMSKQSNGKRTA
jgi:GntR family transcriptional repressor for pyruvate dehydrogenase complex